MELNELTLNLEVAIIGLKQSVMTEICPDQHLVKASQTVPDIGAVPILLRALQLHTLVSGTVRLLL